MTQADTASLPVLSPPLVDSPEMASSRPQTFSFAETPALTSALRAGDEEAYRWIHAEWNSRLSRYCFALAAGDSAMAGEIVQAAYLRMVRHIRVLPDEAALWNWIACAARSAARDFHRKGGRYRRALVRFTEWLSRRPTAPRDDAEPRLAAALDRALGQLEEHERALIIARYFDHRSLDEIGGECGVSARGIEGRLARLRVRLRKMIRASLQTVEATK